MPCGDTVACGRSSRRASDRRRFAPGVAAGRAAVGGTGRPAVGVGRVVGSRRPHGLGRVAGVGRGRIRQVDDEPLRVAAQPAVPPAAGHGPPDFPVHGGRAEPQEARQDRPARAGRPRLRPVALAPKNSKRAIRRGGFRNRRRSPGFRRSLPSPVSPSSPGSRRCISRTQLRQPRRRGPTGCGFGRTRRSAEAVELVTKSSGVDDPELEAALANPRLAVLGVDLEPN